VVVVKAAASPASVARTAQAHVAAAVAMVVAVVAKAAAVIDRWLQSTHTFGCETQKSPACRAFFMVTTLSYFSLMTSSVSRPVFSGHIFKRAIE
jgi:hypothetical protein